MHSDLTILYRGPLASCNYACHYCPFAKKTHSKAEYEEDQQALQRFVHWITSHPHITLSIFFTPWGEALYHQYYQQALLELSSLVHVRKVAIQSNLSAGLKWLRDGDVNKLAIWTSYHPSQISEQKFLRQCQRLQKYGVAFSVGMVGLRQHIDQIESLRAKLANTVYLWVNAYDKARKNYYSEEDKQRLRTIDPLFDFSLQTHPSRGQACRTGHSVISVDGEGTVRRCHFIKKVIANIYDADFFAALKPRPCSRQFCNCHIGYVHMNDLALYDIFQDGILARIPQLSR